MPKERGQLISRELITQEIWDLFRPQEGFNSVYYGRVRNGKTYAATADIIELLERGEIVYANWNVNFEGFDERYSKRHVFFKLLFGKKYFYAYSKDNFHSFHPDDLENPQADLNMKQLGRLVGVHVFIDEGQWLLNSHSRNPDPEAQALVLTNGHYCRSLNIVSQRPSNVFKDYRSQVNFWFKCEKKMQKPFLVFQKTIIEDMKDDMPDEESEYNKTVVYLAKKAIYQSYDRWAFRDAEAVERTAKFDAYRTNMFQRLGMLLGFFVPGRIKAAAARLGERRRVARVARQLDRALEDVEAQKKRDRMKLLDVKPKEGNQT